MKHFTPGPATKAFYDQLMAIANAPAVQLGNAGGNVLMGLQSFTIPTPPPDPIDIIDKAFLHNVCMPLYNAIVAAYQANAAAQATVIGSTFGPPPSATDLATQYGISMNVSAP